MILLIGRKRHNVVSFADASNKYSAERDASGLGASRWPTGTIVNHRGERLARISYNGRVWEDKEFPDAKLLYENR